MTGIGVVTPIGNDVPQLWSSLIEGRSGVQLITRFDASTFPTRFAAEVKHFDESRGPDSDVRTVLDRKDLFGWAAALEALGDAQLASTGSNGCRIGVCLGGQRRCDNVFERLAAGSLYNHLADTVRGSPGTLSAALAAAFQFRGPQLTVSSTCASGTQAIGLGYHKVKWREADVMLCGGSDSMVDPLTLAVSCRIGALSTRNEDPSRACRPFDLHRDGFVLGEGAGIVVLEDLEKARIRGARIYGEVLGYATSANGYRMSDSPPDGGGPYLAMKWALEDAKLLPHDIDYVNAHGTSTRQNDVCETIALKRCFGIAASSIPISATKSMIGHLSHAAGAVEFIVCVLTIHHNVIPPTINYSMPDPECDLDYVPNTARRATVDVALSTSSGFGGVNAAIIVGRHSRDA